MPEPKRESGLLGEVAAGFRRAATPAAKFYQKKGLFGAFTDIPSNAAAAYQQYGPYAAQAAGALKRTVLPAIAEPFIGRRGTEALGLTQPPRQPVATGTIPRGPTAVGAVPRKPTQQQRMLREQQGGMITPGSQQARMLGAQQESLEGELIPRGVEPTSVPGAYHFATRQSPELSREFGPLGILAGTAIGATPTGFRADIAEFGETPRTMLGTPPSFEAAQPLEARVAASTGGLGLAKNALAQYEAGEIDLPTYTALHQQGIAQDEQERTQQQRGRGEQDLQRRLLGQIQQPMSAADIQREGDRLTEEALSVGRDQGLGGGVLLNFINEYRKSGLKAFQDAGLAAQATGARAGEALIAGQDVRAGTAQAQITAGRAARTQAAKEAAAADKELTRLRERSERFGREDSKRIQDAVAGFRPPEDAIAINKEQIAAAEKRGDIPPEDVMQKYGDMVRTARELSDPKHGLDASSIIQALEIYNAEGPDAARDFVLGFVEIR